jgi:enamine deaminase RidA (YjgF/YER057c/UK114 family)
VTARRSAPLALLLLMALWAAAQQLPKIRKPKQDKELPTQTLPLEKEPPAAVMAETAKLTFHVSPLSDKGLLSQQTRDAVKALLDANRGAAIVKLRAFVSGTGDLRRVQSIVSEMFSEKKMALPALTTIQVGGLPMKGAQVEIESVASDKKVVNPNGLAFFPSVKAADAAGAVARLGSAAEAVHVAAGEVVRVTCFLSSLEDAASARAALMRAFPSAAADLVENVRLGTDKSAQCEAVGRREPTSNDPAAKAFAGAPDAVLISAPKLVMSGTQMAFHEDDAELRLAFDRLAKSLEGLGVGPGDVVYARFYPLTRPVEEKLAAMRPQVFPHAAASMLRVEGLPSVDASMGVEVIAAAEK